MTGQIKAKDIEAFGYEPEPHECDFNHSCAVNDLAAFTCEADVIIANRANGYIAKMADKGDTRNLFGKN